MWTSSVMCTATCQSVCRQGLNEVATLYKSCGSRCPTMLWKETPPQVQLCFLTPACMPDTWMLAQSGQGSAACPSLPCVRPARFTAQQLLISADLLQHYGTPGGAWIKGQMGPLPFTCRAANATLQADTTLFSTTQSSQEHQASCSSDSSATLSALS